MEAKPDAAAKKPELEADEAVVVDMPLVPRTKATEISAVAIEQTLAPLANSDSREKPAEAAADKSPSEPTTESPERPASADAVASEPKRTAVDPSTLRETKVASDLISLPRTTSEEWMASDADDGAYEVHPQRPRWVIPAIVAGIAALGVAVILAFGGNNDSAPRTRPVASVEGVGSASEPILAPQADAAVAVAVVPIDAAEVAAVAIDATEVAMAPIDAYVAGTPIDAGLVADAEVRVAEVRVDAAVRVAEVRVDAAVPAEVATKPTQKTDTTVATKPTTKADTTATKTTEPKPPATPKDERTIEQLVDANEFAKANRACATNTIFSTPRLVACALAACNTHSDALAARWIRAIPRASRDEIVAKCKSLGVEVATP